jgi:hypothetical protein
MELVRLIKEFLKETYGGDVEANIALVDFLFRIVWYKEMFYGHFFSTFLCNVTYVIMKAQGNHKGWYISFCGLY